MFFKDHKQEWEYICKHKFDKEPEMHEYRLKEAQKPCHMSVFTSKSPFVHNSQQQITLDYMSKGQINILKYSLIILESQREWCPI